VVVREPKLLKGTEGYMANLLRLLPSSSLPVESQGESAYIDQLTTALADKKLEKNEAQGLAKVAVEMGLSSTRVKELNEGFLDAALAAAMEDLRLEADELKNLKAMAKLLGKPGYFDTLRAERKLKQRQASVVTD
jgi:hypothetical protein